MMHFVDIQRLRAFRIGDCRLAIDRTAFLNFARRGPVVRSRIGLLGGWRPAVRSFFGMKPENRSVGNNGMNRPGRPDVFLRGTKRLVLVLLLWVSGSVRADVVERVIDALVQIESSGRPAVVGDNGAAVGLLQLHPVAVREANRLAGSKRWMLTDRTCPVKSRAMARTILNWHYQRGVTDPVELACRWNKPFGEPTAKYRAKVRLALACNTEGSYAR